MVWGYVEFHWICLRVDGTTVFGVGTKSLRSHSIVPSKDRESIARLEDVVQALIEEQYVEFHVDYFFDDTVVFDMQGCIVLVTSAWYAFDIIWKKDVKGISGHDCIIKKLFGSYVSVV